MIYEASKVKRGTDASRIERKQEVSGTRFVTETMYLLPNPCLTDIAPKDGYYSAKASQ